MPVKDPFVGQPVQYRPSPEDWSAAINEVWSEDLRVAAIITKVHHGDVVDLKVIINAAGVDLWRTKVIRDLSVSNPSGHWFKLP